MKALLVTFLVALPLAGAGWLGVTASDSLKGPAPRKALPPAAAPQAPAFVLPPAAQPPRLPPPPQGWYYTCGGSRNIGGVRPGVHPLYDPVSGQKNIPIEYAPAGYVGPYPTAAAAQAAYVANCLH